MSLVSCRHDDGINTNLPSSSSSSSSMSELYGLSQTMSQDVLNCKNQINYIEQMFTVTEEFDYV